MSNLVRGKQSGQYGVISPGKVTLIWVQIKICLSCYVYAKMTRNIIEIIVYCLSAQDKREQLPRIPHQLQGSGVGNPVVFTLDGRMSFPFPYLWDKIDLSLVKSCPHHLKVYKLWYFFRGHALLGSALLCPACLGSALSALPCPPLLSLALSL